MKIGLFLLLLTLLGFFLSACSPKAQPEKPPDTPTPTSAMPWSDIPVTFSSGANQLSGMLSLPNQAGPFPAIVLISGSANENSGLRSGISNGYLLDQAHHMVKDGFAVLRYDPPGVGKSTGDSRFETLEDRVAEAMAALRYLQSRPDIHPERVGLWGISQGGWVIGMAAAEHPQEVAYLVSVSGAGISVAEQQVWGVETQSRAAGLEESEVARAVLFSRLLIDWQLSEPIYKDVNQEMSEQLGDGPWQDFMKLVYEPGTISPGEALQEGILILEEIQDEPWTKALYLKSLWLPQLRSITPEILAAMKGRSDEGLLTDPKNFMPRVRVPVLAVFGEDDQLVPAKRSAELFDQYLRQAGNENYQIVVFPHADHGLNGAMTDYWRTLSGWLGSLYP